MAVAEETKAGEASLFSPVYRTYMLGLLVFVYAFNFVDRNILAILLPQIKDELQLADWQLGFTGGIAFALFYTAVGLPIAKWADRGNRAGIISLAVAVWSLMTATGFFVQNFYHLVAARIGVGIGEAGCSPPANSIISDVYPPERRATATAIYYAGAPLGGFLGLFIGGWAAQNYGWREAFLVVGLPGFLLALLVKLTLREPPRGMVAGRPATGEASTISGVVKLLWSRPTFRHLAFAAALSAFAGYGHTLWTPSFLVRSHGMSLVEIGTWLGLFSLIGGTTGMIAGGVISDRLAKRDPRWWAWLPGLSIVIGLPFAVAAYLLATPWLVLACLFVPGLTANVYPGPTYSTVQGMVGIKMRAVAMAFVLFIINLIGLGLGPLGLGIMSDVLQSTFGSESLRYTLLFSLIFKLWSAVHFALAARTIVADLARAPD